MDIIRIGVHVRQPPLRLFLTKILRQMGVYCFRQRPHFARIMFRLKKGTNPLLDGIELQGRIRRRTGPLEVSRDKLSFPSQRAMAYG